MALKKFLMIGVVAGLLVACGDDASDNSPVQVAEESSSSVDAVLSSSVNVEESSSSVESEGLSSLVESGTSSSSEKSTEPSSGKNTEPAEVSSCSVAEGSSSSTTVESSSSSAKTELSSSSEKVVDPSSSSKVQESSSSVKVEESSSSAKTDASSSSEKPVESSSSEKVVESSSSEEQNSSSSVLSCIYGEDIYDTRDGKTYKTVKIGKQEWMAENLNYNYKKGKTGSSRSVCFNGIDDNCNEYGQLYPWTVAIDSIFLDSAYGIKCGFNEKNCSFPLAKWKGVCPEGWHIPTRAEWDTLTSSVGGMGKAPRMLKSVEKWIGEVEDTKGIDAVCFSAIPAGNRQSYQYYGLGNNTRFWTADFYKPDAAYRISMSSETNDYSVTHDVTYNAYSVRCIKD